MRSSGHVPERQRCRVTSWIVKYQAIKHSLGRLGVARAGAPGAIRLELKGDRGGTVVAVRQGVRHRTTVSGRARGVRCIIPECLLLNSDDVVGQHGRRSSIGAAADEADADAL